jgi:hypothetical protein
MEGENPDKWPKKMTGATPNPCLILRRNGAAKTASERSNNRWTPRLLIADSSQTVF